MKTAMQELIDSYEKSANQYLEMKQINKASLYFNLAKWAKELLEKEKEQMIDFAYKMRLVRFVSYDGDVFFCFEPDKYYNETYQNK